MYAYIYLNKHLVCVLVISVIALLLIRNMLSGKSSLFLCLLTYSCTVPCSDSRLEDVWLSFGVWLTLINPSPLPVCYCSCVTDALKVFSERRIVRPLYWTIAPTMRTAYAINRQPTYFSHTFSGLPIFSFFAWSALPPTPPNPHPLYFK